MGRHRPERTVGVLSRGSTVCSFVVRRTRVRGLVFVVGKDNVRYPVPFCVLVGPKYHPSLCLEQSPNLNVVSVHVRPTLLKY